MEKLLSWLKVAILIGVIIFGGWFLYESLAPSSNEHLTAETIENKKQFHDMYMAHFKAFMGMPAACATALFLILLLKQKETPIQFKAFTIELKGTSGEIVLWILCFLAIVHGLNTLWPN
jgi:hypothetical protein